MEIKATNNSKHDFIRIHMFKSYLNLAIDDIWGVRVDKPFPFSSQVDVVLETPFGELNLKGEQAKSVLRKIARKEPNISL